jgi:hypothetical protein
MKLHDSGIYYNGSLDKIIENYNASDLVISDNCGTVTKSTFWMNALNRIGLLKDDFKDSSNFNLTWALAAVMLENAIKDKSPKKAIELANYCIKAARLFAKQALSQSIQKPIIIEQYTNSLMSGIPKEDLEKAAMNITKYAYPGALDYYKELHDSGKKIVFVTLSMAENSEANLKRMGIDGKVYGNRLNGEKITSWTDKYAIAKAEIEKSRCQIVEGNNFDDIGLVNAQKESGKPGVIVAVKPISKAFASISDIVAPEPCNLYMFNKMMLRY